MRFVLDPKAVSYIVGVLGILAAAAMGYVKVTTPEAAQCAVDLADKSARLELTTQAMDSCSEALKLCSGGGR